MLQAINDRTERTLETSPEEQKLIEWLSKQEGRKLTPQEEHLSGFKRLTAFRTTRERHRLVAYNQIHLATMRF